MKLTRMAPIAAVLCHNVHAAPAACDRPQRTMTIAYVAADAPARADTTITALVCLTAGTGASGIGSYHGELAYDTSAARVLSVRHPSDGARLENDRAPGVIAFVGASTSTFASGVQLTVRFRLKAPGRAPALVLRISELNDAAGHSLRPTLRVDSLSGPAPGAGGRATGRDSCATGVPFIRSIVPAQVNLSAGDMTPIEITGCAFATTNTLSIGPVTFDSVPSLDSGTRIRFVVPTVLRSTGEVPPRQMPRGTVDVVVTTARASSNHVQLVLK